MKPQDLFMVDTNFCAALMVHYLLMKYQKRLVTLHLREPPPEQLVSPRLPGGHFTRQGRAVVVQKEWQRLSRKKTEAK